MIMFTPQQLDQISFGRSTFGGYDMQQVDEFLEPLTEDYVNLYKENALLKSKMRVLVGKLEEYRKNEASMKQAVANAQHTCDKMVRDAEAKCAQMMNEANAAASAAAAAAPAAAPAPAAPAAPAASDPNTDALVAAETARVEEAKKVAAARITEIQEQMKTCVQALERIKEANAPAAPAGAAARTAHAAAQAAPARRPAAPAQAPKAAPAQRPAAPAAPAQAAAPVHPAPAAAPQSVDSEVVAEEIAQNLEALVGTTEDHAPKAAPRHPVSDSTTSKFASLNLQFGRNYDPSRK